VALVETGVNRVRSEFFPECRLPWNSDGHAAVPRKSGGMPLFVVSMSGYRYDAAAGMVAL